jgi:hypothetical protein
MSIRARGGSRQGRPGPSHRVLAPWRWDLFYSGRYNGGMSHSSRTYQGLWPHPRTLPATKWVVVFLCSLAFFGLACGEDPPAPPRNGSSVYEGGQVTPSEACSVVGGSAAVSEPVFVRNLDTDTGWFSSPVNVSTAAPRCAR